MAVLVIQTDGGADESGGVGMNDQKTIEWRTMAKHSRPPVNTSILIWRGLSDSDGGFPAIGRYYIDRETGESYVAIKPSIANRADLILEKEYRMIRWAEIPMPDEARRKYERNLAVIAQVEARKRRNGHAAD